MQREKSSRETKKPRTIIEERTAITKRLDAIIRLLMESMLAPEGKKSFSKNELVEILHTVDIADTEIGYIIGYERRNVAAMRTNAKKVRKSDKEEQ
jgi:hypothetical protein